MIEVYLDYNGSSPLDPRVGKAMWPALAEWYGNASSTHRFGRRQAAAVEDARARVASLVGGRPSQLLPGMRRSIPATAGSARRTP